MSNATSYDAIVIGSGPNGLAAAIAIARKGRSVVVYEAEETAGGGARSAELTIPGFLHDICSAVHPLAFSSPFFDTLPLEKHGLEWIQPPIPLAHPLDDRPAALLERPIDATGHTLGKDGLAWATMMAPFVDNWDYLKDELLRPFRIPRRPFLMARFGLKALRSTTGLARGVFSGDHARALFAGLAAHSMLPLQWNATAAFGLVLAAAGHAVGWPIPRGGSQQIANALASYLRSLGGEIVTGRRIETLSEVPRSRVILCDVTPRGLLKLAAGRLHTRYRKHLERYRYGVAAFKIDYALDGPVPWKTPGCDRAGTVHLGGTLDEVAEAELAPWQGRHAERPFVLVAQPSLFDATRAPEGKHTLWAYCHVPNGSDFDMTERIENQIGRFAPGFKDRVIARCVRPPSLMERHNANLVGGDINGGVQDLRQLFWRPTRHLYRVPVPGLYLCSSSTPPGGGVHGMCGYFAAQAALKDIDDIDDGHSTV
jgi:phytoene dehydrogenase-like protein